MDNALKEVASLREVDVQGGTGLQCPGNMGPAGLCGVLECLRTRSRRVEGSRAGPGPSGHGCQASWHLAHDCLPRPQGSQVSPCSGLPGSSLWWSQGGQGTATAATLWTGHARPSPWQSPWQLPAVVSGKLGHSHSSHLQAGLMQPSPWFPRPLELPC